MYEPGSKTRVKDRVATAADRDDAGSTAGLTTGVVRAFLTEHQASVEVEGGLRVDAAQAASCLLAPVIGDRVLLYTAGDEAFVLAVLERHTDHAAQLAVPGAGRTVLRSGEGIEIAAPKVSVAAREMNVFARAVSHTGEMLSQNFRRIVENTVDKMIGARSITTRAEMRTAVVREVDMVNAGTLVQNIDSVATQNSEISMVTATQDVRLDAKRVSVG